MNKTLIKGLAPLVPQLEKEGQRARVFNLLFVATQEGANMVMLAYAGEGAARNLIAAGWADAYTPA